MDLNLYQKLAESTALPTALNDEYLFNGLSAEAGEVCGLRAKAVRDDTPDDYSSKLKKELGDVLWFVSVLAAHNGFTLQEVAEANVQKLKSRQTRGVLGGSGDER